MNGSPTPPVLFGSVLIEERALQALDFPRVLEAVARHATSEAGGEAVRALRPSATREEVAVRLDDVEEMVRWLVRDDDWGPPAFPDVRLAIERLQVAGSVWSETDLAAVLRLLVAARDARRSIAPQASKFPHLGELADGLLADESLQSRLAQAIDEETETLKDGASAQLGRLKRSIRSTRSELVAKLEAIMSSLGDRVAVRDASVTVRAGRYCIPIRREGRSEVGGIVHDESASRATLFVEPPAAIELMNGLREFELDEAREVQRILRELSDALRPQADEILETCERLIELDSRFARARHALALDCSRPVLVDRGSQGFRIVNGRHPLLLESSRPVVPFELAMDAGEHTLLITGPNAGGKTVLLKAVGLVSAMTQSGLLAPVGPGTELPVYTSIFADIGDEQSIDASLSTFTAHLKNLTEILGSSEGDSLCLIDEIGGATDPAEGTALARAVLLILAERGCMTLATSHLGGLKTLPGVCPAIVSAGLGFDTEKLEPLYKLTKGRPGRSYALAMAQRVGLPAPVIERARSSLSESEVRAEELLTELEEKEALLASRLVDVERRENTVARLESILAEQEVELNRREREMESEGRRQARDFLLDARKQVEEALKSRREEADSARRALEESLRAHSRALKEASKKEPQVAQIEHFDPGDSVWVDSLSREGRVLERRGADVLVEVGGVKLQLAAATLKRAEADSAPKQTVSTHAGVEVEAHHEVHLLGLNADEARAELSRAVDGAVLAGLQRLRVVHGKGTGVLRAAVAEYVKTDKRVRSHSMAAPHEGGSGVTILELE